MSQQIAQVRVVASPKNWIEGSAVQQLERTALLPGIRLAVGLPDLHPGKGSPIGAAFIAENWIYPALVGNDIGCGIGLWRTSLGTKRVKQEAWADRLRNLDHEWAGNIGGNSSVRVGFHRQVTSIRSARSAAGIISLKYKWSRVSRMARNARDSELQRIACTFAFTADHAASANQSSETMSRSLRLTV